MSMYGFVTNVMVKDERNSQIVRKISGAQLELTLEDHHPKLIIRNTTDNTNVYEFRLDDCTHVEESSKSGSVESIRIGSKQLIVLFFYTNNDCGQLVEELRRPSTDRSQREPPRPPHGEPNPPGSPRQNSEETAQQLIRALNGKEKNEAERLASLLAQNRASIRFALDLINESGNSAPPAPVQPVVKPLRLKLSIESFLIDQCNNELHDVSILPGTTIKDLKDLVQQNTAIPPDHQYWYINRDNLADGYIFGQSQPRVNANTILILFIVKPQEE